MRSKPVQNAYPFWKVDGQEQRLTTILCLHKTALDSSYFASISKQMDPNAALELDFPRLFWIWQRSHIFLDVRDSSTIFLFICSLTSFLIIFCSFSFVFLSFPQLLQLFVFVFLFLHYLFLSLSFPIRKFNLFLPSVRSGSIVSD